MAQIAFVFFLNRRKNLRLKNLPARAETAVYGKRMLLIDSAEEFSNQNREREVVREIQSEWKRSEKWSAFLKNEYRIRMAEGSIWILSLLVLSFLFPKTVVGFQQKRAEVESFLSAESEFLFPFYYLEGVVLEIDFSGDIAFDQAELSVDHHVMLSTNGHFEIPEEFTTRESISLELTLIFYGKKRIIASGEMEATSRLLPNSLKMLVDYGFESESYSSLQDIEIWSGGRVTIYGDFTKELNEVLLSNRSISSSLSGKSFSLSFTPTSTTAERIVAISADGDSFISPEFTIRIQQNEAPELSLIFPQSDVMLADYYWSVSALLEAEDDQALSALEFEIVITNRNPAFSGQETSSFSEDLNDVTTYRGVTKLSYEDLYLLPDSVASVNVYATDSFGLESEVVSFNLISPNILEMGLMRDEAVEDFYSSTGDVETAMENFSEDIENQDLAGASQSSAQVSEAAESLSSAVESVSEAFDDEISSLAEILEAVSLMKELTEQISQHAESITEIAERLQNEEMNFEQVDLSQMEMSDMLEELQSLMSALEYYEAFSEMLDQLDIIENSFEALKDAETDEEFETAQSVYEEALSDLSEMSELDDIDEVSDALNAESENLQMQDSGSFEYSEALMNELSEQISKALQNASQNKMNAKIDSLNAVIDELYICVLILNEANGLDLGTILNADVDNLASVSAYVNAVDSSLSSVNTKVEEVLTGLVFTGNAGDEITGMLEDLQEIMDYTLTALRDNSIYQIEYGLNYLENYTGALVLSLLKVNEALSESMQSAAGESGTQSSMKQFSMAQLMMMQSLMSSSMEQMLKQIEEQGGMSEEMQQTMDDLADLQQQISDAFQELLQSSSDGAISGGEEIGGKMDDLIEALSGYNIDSETLQLSEELEELLLESTQSLQSQGLSQERQGESAGIYEVTSPDENSDNDYSVDLESIGDATLSEYYKKLIEAYMEE